MGNLAASVRAMERAPAADTVDRDADARRWIAALRASDLVREERNSLRDLIASETGERI